MRRLAVLIVLFLTGCSAGGSSVSEGMTNGSDASSVQSVDRDYLFQKKVECQNYVPAIERKLKENDQELSHQNVRGSTESDTTLDKIYYSISRNSCLYETTHHQYYRDANGSLTAEFDTWWLSDALTNEGLMDTMGQFGTGSYLTAQQEFQDELKNYQ